MTQKDAIKLFEDRQVRSVWDSEAKKWYISIIDVIEVLTDSANPPPILERPQTQATGRGSQLYENIVQLKMKSSDGKSYNTDVADVEQLFRLIQSIPSPKAEPFKQWLAQLGRERLEEIDDPEQGIERLMEYYHSKGYSANWINQRLKSIEVRKETLPMNGNAAEYKKVGNTRSLPMSLHRVGLVYQQSSTSNIKGLKPRACGIT